MIKNGIRNGELAKFIATLGEGDVIILSGCRFSLPEGVPVIDLAVTDNLPRMESVLNVLVDVCMFTEATIAHEMDDSLKEKTQPMMEEYKVNELTYRQLQVLAKNASVVVRTGDMSSASAIVLRV